MTGDGDNDEECDSRITLELVREAGDWMALEPVEPMAETAARALLASVPHGLTDTVAPRRADPPLPQKPRLEACLVLADDAHVRALNRDWRGQDKPTNVLSFPAAGGPVVAVDDGPRFLGDIVIAVETLAREATDDGIGLPHHFQHLLIHGLLHLLGYDHQTAAEAEAMEAIEVEALARLGISSPYEGREPVPPG